MGWTSTQFVGDNPPSDVESSVLPGFDIPPYDYISCSYTGSDMTGVVYKSGGASGTVVATLTLTYNSGNLTSVTKS